MVDTDRLKNQVSRRKLLGLIGGASVVAIVGCGDDEESSGTATSTQTAASTGTRSATVASTKTPAPTDADASCETIPEETAGPFPGDGSNGPNVLAESSVVRKDIRSSFGSASGVAEGVPLTIRLVIQDAAHGCAPLAGAAVYAWHCDREGRYSIYSQGVTDENYLRGVQAADSDGVVTFTSIFPGCYAGRWPHIHFEVYSSLDDATDSDNNIATSQIALPEDTCQTVYETVGYEESITNLARVSLSSDNVFGDDDGELELGTISGSLEAGLTVELLVPVNSA